MLAQVDSSVGGKVGVNLPKAKNMVGAFKQPIGVLIDTKTLDTLDIRQYRAGLGEVVKYGVIMDEEFFKTLEENVDRLNARDHDLLRDVVARCCRLKGDVVEADEPLLAGVALARAAVRQLEAIGAASNGLAVAIDHRDLDPRGPLGLDRRGLPLAHQIDEVAQVLGALTDRVVGIDRHRRWQARLHLEATPIERVTAKPAEPTEEEVDRFIRLRDAAHERDRVKKNRVRVEKALGKAAVNLTKRQREQIHAAYARFQPRVDQIWDEAKEEARETIESGGDFDKEGFVSSTMGRIQQEFAGALDGIVSHQGDAEAIAAALMPTPGGK